VGENVGALEGQELGSGVGLFTLYVGARDGETVGASDGRAVGRGVGNASLYVGDRVGERRLLWSSASSSSYPLRSFVGFDVGEIVGCLVG